ncbi:MAG: TatD family hydrolase [Pseudomonadota bacterium]|nr:TatD family hydrolase [Pseudomonadota bacterium]
MRLVDSHSHFDDASFAADRAAVLARAQAAGVMAQIVPATHADGWAQLERVCAEHAGLYPAYGLHPVFLPQHLPAHLHALRQQLSSSKPCVAVGEIGLDYFLDTLDRQRQQDFFEAQLKLALEFNLPVIIHARRAFDAVIATLRRFPGSRGVIHSFSGSLEQAKQLCKMGFMLGIGGPLTYPRAQRLRRTVAEIPLDYLLLETDSPDQPDSQWRGQRNEPARLLTILNTLAELRQETPERIAAATTANAERLFAIDIG